MQPASLVYILWANRHEPVLTVAKIRAKFHYHISELVQIRPRPEILYRFVFEHAYFLGRESVHFDDFQGLTVELKWKGELFKLSKTFV